MPIHANGQPILHFPLCHLSTAIDLSHWPLVRMATGPNSNPNVVVDLRNKEILNSLSYVHAPFRNPD